MGTGPSWDRVYQQQRQWGREVGESSISARSGVYAWFRDGTCVYSGRAVGGTGLRRRIWNGHLGTVPDLSRSSFRRNLCEHLGIAASPVTRQRPTRMTASQIDPDKRSIRECGVAWIECRTEHEAKAFEQALLAEFKLVFHKR